MMVAAAAVRSQRVTQTEGTGSGVTKTHDDLEAASFATTAYDADRPPVPQHASTEDSLIGRRIDHFEIRALLGEGGMGTVYLAHDCSLERPVAIKVLRRELGDKPELCERLVLEAQAQARLTHPNVVNVYYIGSHAGAPYFAMEYIRGESLADRLARSGPLGWQDALEAVIETTRALFDAHARGIVHRDVKPSNLLVQPRDPRGAADGAGHVKVADFGLAAEPGIQQEHMVGSPTYASPEQLSGKAPDQRSDIYSLGITFFELLTGKPPFEADSFGELVHMHETAPRPEIPAERAPWRLRRLIKEMMASKPTDRPWTYDELLGRLEALRPRAVEAAGLSARLLALGVDVGLAVGLGLLARELGVTAPAALTLASVAFAAHFLAGHRLWGQSLGKRLLRLRIEGIKRAISVPRLSVRLLALTWGPAVAGALLLARPPAGGLDRLATASPDELGTALATQIAILALWGIGLVAGAFDERRRALHDVLGRTRVIYATPADLPPRRHAG